MSYFASRSTNRRTVLTASAAGALGVTLASRAHAQPSRSSAVDAEAAGAARGMSLEEKVGQLFMPHVYGTSATTRDPEAVAKNREAWGVDNAAQLIDEYHLGAIIYFTWANTLHDPKQVAKLSNGIQHASMRGRARLPMLIGTDQEQGLVTRIGHPATTFPGNMALGAGRSTEDARTAARITGSELAAMGIHQNFAPVADVNINPANPVIGVRSFGSDPRMAARMTAAAVRGYQEDGGISAAAKHFPGHGDTTKDSHLELPTIEHTREEWQRIDRPPFAAAIDEGVNMIMTGHLVFPAFDASGDPATLSEPIMTGLLREALGYDGVVVTDALTMAAVREKYGDDRVPILALQAGVDLLDKPPEGKLDLQYNAVLDAVRSGEISQRRLHEAVFRILRLKARLGLFRNPYVNIGQVDRQVGTPETYATAQRITDRTVTLVKNDNDLLPLTADTAGSVLVTGWGSTTTETLAAKLGRHGLNTERMYTGNEPSDAEIDTAVAAARSHDATVVTTGDAAGAPAQQQLVRRLVATGKPVAAVAVGGPYDVAHFPEVPAYLATYSYTDVSLASLARVLTGEVEPSGKLPVVIPKATDPTAELYPYGFGIRYSE